MKHLIHQHTISFKNAFAGLIWAFRTQPNFKIHFILSMGVIVLGKWFTISSVEWIVLLLTIVMGITGELLNTSIEAVTDLVTSEWRKEAKIAKDVAAGMMLFIAIGSVIVAGFIFLPYLLNVNSNI